jgi:hypothetical protein
VTDMRMVVKEILTNGAVLETIWRGCDICIRKEQEMQQSSFTLMFKGEKLYVCDAHAEQLLYMDADRRRVQEGEFKEFIGQSI